MLTYQYENPLYSSYPFRLAHFLSPLPSFPYSLPHFLSLSLTSFPTPFPSHPIFHLVKPGGRISEDNYQSYDDLDEDEDQAFVKGGYFKQKKTLPSSGSTRPLPASQRHHPLQPSRETVEDDGYGHGASPSLGRDDDREGVSGAALTLAMNQFTIERKHYPPSHTPTSISPPPDQAASSSSSSSTSPKKSLSLHKMLATHHYHTPGGSSISAVAHGTLLA